jgi:hypothetical protein
MPTLKLRRLLLKCSVVLLEHGFNFLFGITPRLQKCPQIFPRAAPKYLQHHVPSFFLILDRIRTDGLLLAPAPLFANYVVEIVALFHRALAFLDAARLPIVIKTPTQPG